jgi:hypothetical protein
MRHPTATATIALHPRRTDALAAIRSRVRSDLEDEVLEILTLLPKLGAMIHDAAQASGEPALAHALAALVRLMERLQAPAAETRGPLGLLDPLLAGLADAQRALAAVAAAPGAASA